MNINSTNNQKIATYCETCVCKSCDKYKTALEEIKEAILDFIPKENYKFATSLHPEFYGLIEFIQDKINEVLESEGE